MTPGIRTVVADDERPARKKLRILLNFEPGVQIVAECRDGKQTIAAVQTHKPDLLFLDIRMPDADGFEVLAAIRPWATPVVIFTTAYDQYAIRAFEAHAFDYLLKPFGAERLHDTIERTRAELSKAQDRHLGDRILELMADSSRQVPRVDRRLAIEADGRVIFLDFAEIEWIEAAANYVRVNVGKCSYLLREGIGRISQRLDPALFVRIHRSTIVNVRKIRELQICPSSEYIAILRSGKELSCSRGHYSEIQKLIQNIL